MPATPYPQRPTNSTGSSRRLDGLVYRWLAERAGAVADKTLRVDHDLLRLVPRSYLHRDPQTITPDDIEQILAAMRARRLSEPSIRRHRASLSKFFSWCVRAGELTSSPVVTPTTPIGAEPAEIKPFGRQELESAWEQWSGLDPVLADVMLVLARTGIRWGEARVLTVADVHDGVISVDKVATEGVTQRALSPAHCRTVKIPERVVGIVTRLASDRDKGDLLLTTSRRAQLHRSAVMRTLRWSRTGRGRRLHDLRHTAASLWLAEGVDVATVRTWMGPTRLADLRLAS